MTYIIREVLVVFFFVTCLQFSCSQDYKSCELPKKLGNCNARIERWFFNIKQGKCRKFLYSGCDGNPNNFKTKNDCKKACNVTVCRLPKNTGQCSLSQTKWYYDIDAMICKKFIYTGCQGNKNRFSTEKKCKQRCDGVKFNPCPPPPPCLPHPDNCGGPDHTFISGVRCVYGCGFSSCKPGNCPSTSSSNCTQCMYSADCHGSLICCKGCCRIPVTEPKEGSCPTTGIKTCVGSSSECSLDSHCPGDRKCCVINNGKCCVSPQHFDHIGY